MGQHVWIHQEENFIYLQTCSKLSASRMQVSLLQFELMNHQKILSSALATIERDVSRIPFMDHHAGMRNIMDVLLSNELIAKYIFQSRETTTVWKSLMIILKMLLSFNVPLLYT